MNTEFYERYDYEIDELEDMKRAYPVGTVIRSPKSGKTGTVFTYAHNGFLISNIEGHGFITVKFRDIRRFVKVSW